jgi:hypothetical protein
MDKPEERGASFAAELAEVYGAALRSVVLYGSAARGEHRAGASDLNILVLLDDAGPEALRRGAPLAGRWAAGGNPPPLVLSRDEWARSADVFAIEYADIRDAHRVLAGADPFEGVQVERDDLRRQCERELKGKNIQLRERYLLLADRPEELGRVFAQSLSTFLVLFRTVLRLAGETVPRDPEQVVRRTAVHAGFAPEPVLELVAARAAGGSPRLDAVDPIAVGYLDAVARVVEYVDRLMDGAPG